MTTYDVACKILAGDDSTVSPSSLPEIVKIRTWARTMQTRVHKKYTHVPMNTYYGLLHDIHCAAINAIMANDEQGQGLTSFILILALLLLALLFFVIILDPRALPFMSWAWAYLSNLI